MRGQRFRRSFVVLAGRRWRRVATAVALVATALSLSGCAISPQLFACIVSGDVLADECHRDALAPGPPAAPTGVEATFDADGYRVSWTANTEPDVEAYSVYFWDTPGGPYELVVKVGKTKTEALVPQAVCQTLYFVVTAVDNVGQESPFSAEASPACGADERPAAPVGLTATPGNHFVQLDWDDNAEADLAGYKVYRLQPATGEFILISGGLITASEYLDEDRQNGVELFYRVTAVDQTGQESDPSEVSATPSAILPLTQALRDERHEPDSRSFPFTLTVSGRYSHGGSARLEAGRLVGDDLVFEGEFELKIPGHEAKDGLRGTWRSSIDWLLDPGARSGTATGLALATFADPKVGEACLRFEETYAAKGTKQVATRGTFTYLGGTASLLGEGSYRVDLRRDGSLVYRGKAHAAEADAPGLPAECEALTSLARAG